MIRSRVHLVIFPGTCIEISVVEKAFTYVAASLIVFELSDVLILVQLIVTGIDMSNLFGMPEFYQSAETMLTELLFGSGFLV